MRPSFHSGGSPRPAVPVDYGIDAPDAIRWSAVVAAADLALGVALAGRYPRVARIVLALGLLWGLNPLGMYLSSKRGKLAQREATLDLVDFRGDETVLDVGTGHGLMAIGAAQRLRSGQVYGIDIWQQQDQADNLLVNTRRNVELAGVADRCLIQDGDARAIPFPDASFDVVLASFALHNVPGRDAQLQVCREIARVLKPGGRVLDYDMVFTTDIFVQGFAAAGLEVTRTGWLWRTYPPGQLIVGTKPSRSGGSAGAGASAGALAS